MAQPAKPEEIINKTENKTAVEENITSKNRTSLLFSCPSEDNDAWLKFLEDRQNNPNPYLDSDSESDDYPQEYVDSRKEELKFWKTVYLEAGAKTENVKAASLVEVESVKKDPTSILSKQQRDFLARRPNYEEYMETVNDFMNHYYILQEKIKQKDQNISTLKAKLEEQKKSIIEICKKQLKEI